MVWVWVFDVYFDGFYVVVVSGMIGFFGGDLGGKWG